MVVVIILFAIFVVFFSFDYDIMSFPILTSSQVTNIQKGDSVKIKELLFNCGIKKPDFFNLEKQEFSNGQYAILYIGDYLGTDILVKEWTQDVAKKLKKHGWKERPYPSSTVSYFFKNNNILILSYLIENGKVKFKFILS